MKVWEFAILWLILAALSLGLIIGFIWVVVKVIKAAW